MHPILFEIGSFQIPSYGAGLVFAFLVATWFLKREANREGLDPKLTVDTAIAGLLFGLIGAKLLLLIVDMPYYLEEPRRIFGTLRSAGVIYGGLVFGTFGIVWFMRRKGMPIWQTLDTMAPFAALGVGLGRLSCLMAGCCYGIHYDGPLALVFPDHPECRADPGIPLFPVQILSLVNGIVLCLVLLRILRKRRFDGQVLIAYLFLYSLTRGLIEFVRGDGERGTFLGDTVSTSQLIAIAGVVIAALWYRRRARAATSEGS